MPEQKFNLVVPLAHEATDMREADTRAHPQPGSGAVSAPSDRGGDVTSTTRCRATSRTRGTRTSTTATRTTTTSTTSFAPAPSADRTATARHADYSFPELVAAYVDCRRTKRSSPSALAFEQDLERNLCRLDDELAGGGYRPGRSICFVVRRPKPREVWAAAFRDRVVHHLLYNRAAGRFERAFIADSCACIPGRGTLYAARRLEAKVRSATESWSKPAHYLKCDVANFFVTIDKRRLEPMLSGRIPEPWWRALVLQVLHHDPRTDVEVQGRPESFKLVPPHKSLFNAPAHLGLPIGNLSSQFFANVYLNALDQHVKHVLRTRHYVRYVDDFVLLHAAPHWLNEARAAIATFITGELGLALNDSKTVLQPVARGIDFVGHLVKPWHSILRRRTFHEALSRLAEASDADVWTAANSYFGLLRQATHSHGDRARLANLLRRRGFAVDHALTKAYAP